MQYAFFSIISLLLMCSLQTYSSFTIGDFYQLRQCLLRFYQDRKIKVSLFLHDGLQNEDGTLVLKMDGPATNGGSIPGIIKYYSFNFFFLIMQLNQDRNLIHQKKIFFWMKSFPQLFDSNFDEGGGWSRSFFIFIFYF